MKRFLFYLLSLAMLISGCVQSSEWTRKDIDKKLKEVFPDAQSIRILDTVASKKDNADTLEMPMPDYKALVTEKDLSPHSFIFYFYNTSLRDTSTFTKVFRAMFIHDIRAGLGNKQVEYVLGVPQFDNSGSRLIVYAVALALPESYDLAAREKEIRKGFNLQETKIEDIKIDDSSRQEAQ